MRANIETGIRVETPGQYDGLGELGPDAWKGIHRWWIQKGKVVVTDVASARDAAELAVLSLAFEDCAPRLA